MIDIIIVRQEAKQQVIHNWKKCFLSILSYVQETYATSSFHTRRYVKMAYKIVISDVTELSEEIMDVSFASEIPNDSFARSSDIEAVLTVRGKISFDIDKLFMRDAAKNMAVWSLVKPESADAYKKVTVEYQHAAAPRKYELSHAFVVSYHENFTKTDGEFVLVLKQKKDRIDGIVIE